MENMASTGGGQHQYQHQQHQQHKISPRKFSEKIALLNKKEAEGNAEFEEIIKEVQATRCQSACGGYTTNGRMGDGGSSSRVLYGVDGLVDEANLTSEQQDELEEVYQDLIKGIKQCDHNQQHRDPIYDPNAQTNLNVAFDRYNSPNLRSSSSASLVNHSNGQQQQPLVNDNHQAQSTCVNISSNNDLNIPFMPAYETTQDTTTKRNNILEPYPFYAQEPVAAAAAATTTSCRARGTSVGSTNYKHICANALQPRTYLQHPSCNNNNNSNYTQAQDNTSWLVSNCGNGGGSDGIYLKPGGYDRTWQKSSSDPALHVPYNLMPADSIIVDSPCPDNYMVDQTMDLEQCQQTQGNQHGNNNSEAPVDTDDNNNNNNSGAMPAIDSSGQQENMGPAAVAATTLYTNYIESSSSATIPTNQDQYFTVNGQPAAEMGGFERYANCNDHNERSSNNNNDNTAANIRGCDLPGIKICAIDDDCSQGRRQQDNQVSRASSSSDLGLVADGVQFNGGSFDKRDQIEFEQMMDDQSNDGQQQHQAGRNMATVEWMGSGLMGLSGGGGTAFENQANQSTCGGWPATNISSSNNLYEPKVNNLLSNSECGLSRRRQLLMATDEDSCNLNMIRSHSHNSIYYLTGHKKTLIGNNHPAGNHYHQPQQYHFQQQLDQPHYSQQQQQHYMLGNQVQLEPMQLNRPPSKPYDGSASSMQPQHGSMSPLDSSSNLTSPQSEQNSPPGSSSGATTDHGEPMLSFNRKHQLDTHPMVSEPAGGGGSGLDDGSEAYLASDMAGCEPSSGAYGRPSCQQEVAAAGGTAQAYQAQPGGQSQQQQQHFQNPGCQLEPARTIGGQCQSPFSSSRRQ